jgi:hypothetical protein
VEETGKHQLEPVQDSMADAQVFSRYSLLRNHLPKPTGVLEHYRKGGTKCWLSIFEGSFLLTASLRLQIM